MDKIRWGIVGPGCIAHKFADAIKNVGCASLIAVASRTEENGKAFAQKHSIPMVFVGYKTMATSPDIDAVYISTPHPFHLSCAELFLKAGKHVLCEKPLCVNAMQAQSLKECAASNGVFLMEAMWTRFLPAIQEVCKVIKSGAIGEVLSVSADFCYRTTPEEEAKLFINEMAGGSLLDVGVYGLHFASLIFGNKPECVKSVMQVENGVDTLSNVLLRYDGGAVASISSAISVYKPEEAYVYGTKGYIKIPCFYGADDFFICTDEGEEHIKKPYMGNGFEEEIYEVCSCIKQGRLESSMLPLSETIAVLKIMDTARAQNNVVYSEDNR